MTTIGPNNYQPILAKATKKPEDKKPVEEKTVDKNPEGVNTNNTQQVEPQKPVKLEELRGYYNISPTQNGAGEAPAPQKASCDEQKPKQDTVQRGTRRFVILRDSTGRKTGEIVLKQNRDGGWDRVEPRRTTTRESQDTTKSQDTTSQS